jgi:hypothetical protein
VDDFNNLIEKVLMAAIQVQDTGAYAKWVARKGVWTIEIPNSVS